MKAIYSATALDREIGVLIRARRVERKIPKAALARRMQVHRRTVDFLEAGRNRIAVSTVYLLANQFDCDPQELLPEQWRAI